MNCSLLRWQDDTDFLYDGLTIRKKDKAYQPIPSAYNGDRGDQKGCHVFKEKLGDGITCFFPFAPFFHFNGIGYIAWNKRAMLKRENANGGVQV